MTMSDYIKNIRAKIGDDLLMLPTTSGVIVNEAGEVLMIRHTDAGQWLLPGGMIEPRETPQQAVVREMREELGVEVELGGLVGVLSGPEFVHTYKNGHEVCFVMSTFVCRITDGQTIQPDAAEVLEVCRVNAENWKELAVAPWMHTTLPIVFAYLDKLATF